MTNVVEGLIHFQKTIQGICLQQMKHNMFAHIEVENTAI